MPKFKKKPPTKPGFYEVRQTQDVYGDVHGRRNFAEEGPTLIEVVEWDPGVFGYKLWENASEVWAIDPDNADGDEWRATKRTWRSETTATTAT